MLLWLVAAAAATAVGLTAVGAIGTDLLGSGSTPLSESEVDAQLASRRADTTTPPPTSPPPTTSASRPPASPGRTSPPKQRESARSTTTTTPGGTVISRCAPGGVQVLQATPVLGFRVDSDDTGRVDDHPSVKFRSGEREIEVRLRCAGGRPQAEVEDD
ncbi:hypothetical protein BU204_09110 [Actinophytocola xanthii]|uniref:Septum formation initiator n=1 Tax=Actinophytocola xanthii TaxID=1912961 RepID=A0A1Q8CUB4_9PSEU|nr:hypothetical protein BU204_09110 [Actinophytocola xanthii]